MMTEIADNMETCVVTAASTVDVSGRRKSSRTTKKTSLRAASSSSLLIRRSGEAETTDRWCRDEKEEAMMQPRDAHDDGDCAMEEAGGHSSPLPPVMTTTTSKTGLAAVDASSPSSSSNHHVADDNNIHHHHHQQQQQQHQLHNQPLSNEAAAAAAALVGARKRKALRVVKHQQQQQQASPIRAETNEPEPELTLIVQKTEQGNTSMDTGVSSDLSESRPSLAGEEEEEEEEMDRVVDDDDDIIDRDDLSHGSVESGGEFDRVGRRHGHRQQDSDSDSNQSINGRPEDDRNEDRRRQRRIRRTRRRGGRKRQLTDNDDDEEEDHLRTNDDSRCHSIAKQRITIRQDGTIGLVAGSASVAAAAGQNSSHRNNSGIDLTASQMLRQEQANDHQHLKCPECGDASFASRANLIHHVQMAHPATLAGYPWAATTTPPVPLSATSVASSSSNNNVVVATAAATLTANVVKDLADIPSILHLANAAAAVATTTPSGRHVNNMFLHDEILTNPPEEYKNEEDDPFSAVLREMKIKGEFPCRLCQAVFPNLRALKGHNRNHLTHAPYRCNMCPSTSHDKGALIRHMRTHNGERPYECRDCQYAFTTKANCERHLRNRHGKVNRDALRASIIYHLSEDSAANRAAADNGSNDEGGDYYRSGNSALDLSADRDDSLDEHSDRRRRDDDDESTDYPSEDEIEQDGPLDLTVDVLDLTKRRQEVVARPAAPPSCQAVPVTPVSSAPTTPAIPAPPAAQTEVKQQQQPSVFAPSYFGSPYSGAAASLAGLPFFYPGLGGASYSAFLESKLAEMGNPAVDLSALALAAAHHDALRQAQQQQQQQVQPQPQSHSIVEGLLMPAIKKYPEENRPASMPVTPIKIEKKSSSSSHSQAVNNDPGVKMVLKNGVLVKKQKQRRYRTERPFGCEHCTARFTLRSNMERHIKQQHPDIWSTRPRGHRRSACALTKSSSALPTLVDMKNHVMTSALTPPGVSQHQITQEAIKEAMNKAPISEQVRQAVQQKLKKRRNSEHSEDDEDDDEEEEEEEEEEDGALVIDERKDGQAVLAKTEPADLASVSKLLTNAVAQTFQQYFSHREEAEEPSDKHRASPSEGNTDEMDEGECTSISDGQSGGSDFGGNRSDSGQAVKGKKKSAYSNAPHRVSCPYCSRKFPWTSSLRRHILTHTGQKPYKCPQCPLWFTTKSNCDRHLLRKHGNHLHGGNNGGAGGCGSSGAGGGSGGGGGGSGNDNSRNVPDRPYKCALCPSSTFATSDNLKKHVDNKHCPAHGPGMSSPESISAAGDDDSKRLHNSHPTSPSAGDGQTSSENLPFKCHLCDDSGGYAERQEVLDHLQQEHTEEFHDLVGKVGALVAEPPPMPSAPTSDDGEDYDSVRGKFPDYVNRKVICAFCLRRFWSAEDLRRHMRTHSGERPYQCDVCSRRFTLKHSMLRHRRKHGGSGQAEESDEEEEEEEEESGSDRSHRHREAAAVAAANAAAAAAAAAAKAAKVRMQALWSGHNAGKKSGMRLRGPFASDLIGNLLGIPDTSIVEQLMSKPADDAARLLGVTGNRV